MDINFYFVGILACFYTIKV